MKPYWRDQITESETDGNVAQEEEIYFNNKCFHSSAEFL